MHIWTIGRSRTCVLYQTYRPQPWPSTKPPGPYTHRASDGVGSRVNATIC